MNSTIITRAQTPTSMYKYRTQASTLPVLSSSAVCWYCRRPQYGHTPHPTPNPSTLSGLLLLYVAILSKVRRSDLSLRRSTLSLTLNPSGVWVGMIEKAVPYPPRLADPRPSVPPSSSSSSIPSTFPSIGHFSHSVTQSIIKFLRKRIPS